MNTCQKDQEPHIGQCCCTCNNHHKDFHHPCTTGEGCTDQRGWICIIDDGETGLWCHSGWSEHGMCEMWGNKKEKENKNVNE